MKSDFFYRLMFGILRLRDVVAPVDNKANQFGIKERDTVIDYGCGVGSYTKALSKLVGSCGRVYAVDNHPLAIKATNKKIEKYKLSNVKTFISTSETNSGISDNNVADVVLVLDMFHMISNTNAFLVELHRLIKPTGFILIEVEHMADEEISKKVNDSGLWIFREKVGKYLKYSTIE